MAIRVTEQRAGAMQSDDQAAGAKRPRATIEGSAREVTRPADDAAGDDAPHAASGPEPAAGPAAFPPAWRPTLIAAAIASACAVVAVFAVLAVLRFASEPSAGALRALVGAEQPARQVAELGHDIEALRARIATVERLETRLSDLARELDEVGQAQRAAGETTSTAAAASAGRISELEDRFAALDAAALANSSAVEGLRREIAAAAESGASAAAVATRLSREVGRIDALESTLRGVEQNLSALRGETANLGDSLTARIEAARSGAAADGGSGASDRLDRLETATDGLSRRLDALALPAVLTAHDALVAKAAAGRPFDRELAAIALQIADGQALAALEPLAGRAVPTIAMLAERLTDLAAPDAVAPDRPGDADSEPSGLVDRLVERASRLVQVRRVDPEGGAGELGRARALLGRNDLPAAAATVAALPRRAARDAWLDDARARIDLDRALAALDEALGRRVRAAGARGNG